MTNELEGTLGYKGERGYSAYELAVQHGYQGTEEQWCEDFTNAENFYDKTEMDSILSGYVETTTLSDYVPKTDIVDNLTSTDTNKPLSAKQGKELKDTTNTININLTNTNGVLLWKNPDRGDSLTFAAQSIDLDLSDYDCIEIACTSVPSIRMFKYVKTSTPHSKVWTSATATYSDIYVSQVFGRNVSYNLSNNKLVFSDGVRLDLDGYSGTNNTIIVPIYIIGYKKNIFELDEYDS